MEASKWWDTIERRRTRSNCEQHEQRVQAMSSENRLQNNCLANDRLMDHSNNNHISQLPPAMTSINPQEEDYLTTTDDDGRTQRLITRHKRTRRRRRNNCWLTIITTTIALVVLTLTLTPKLILSYNLDYQKALAKFGQRGSYFGYSIAQHANYDTSNENATYRSYVLVGAPRADSLRATAAAAAQRPGAIYKCDFSLAESCSQLDIDSTLANLNNQQSSLAYSLSGSSQEQGQPTRFITAASRDPVANRSDQWLGVSVKSQGPNGYAVVCAHRYVLQGPSYRWPQGICYSLTRNLTFHKTWQPCLNRPVNKAHEEYGTCQAGTASDISDTSDIVLGAPGPYTWRGTIFSNSIAFTAKDDRTWYMAPVQDEDARVYKYSYLGMSLVTGRFFQAADNNKQYYVSGAPRSQETGQVLVMSKQGHESNLKTDQILNGKQMGSAFGYTLAKLDFNGDGRQDLVVSAPFYYSKNESGAVYLYSNDGKSFVASGQLTGTQAESRFGFSLANCGDLNHDKYEDLAVGAPYEQPGGVVYIYLGSSAGLRKEPSQRIEGSSVRSGLQTFGYSLTGGLDMDKNGYPDLVVGSYADDAVFILRGRPIVEISTKIEGNLSRIDPTKTHCDGERNSTTNKHVPCFKFNACFELINPSQLGKYSDSMKLKYRIEAETFTGQKYSRVKFQGSESSKMPNVVEKEIILNDYQLSSGKRCNVQRVYLKDLTDVQTPIQFKLTYTLEPPTNNKERSSSSTTRYTLSSSSSSITSNQMISSQQEQNPAANVPPPFPILNQEEAMRIFSASFLKDCGLNEICESHLDVDGSLQMPRETLGINEPGYASDKQINVTIRVANNMEPAYEARLFVTHPSQLTYSGFKASKQVSIVECLAVERNLVKCELGNPMTKGTSKLLMLFNTQNQAGTFDFNLMVNTTSQNAKEARTSYDLSGTIKRKVEIPLAPKLPPAYPEPPMQEPPAWLILLSVLLGILLFAALFYCLYVNGFFERSKARYTAANTEERF